MPEIMVCQLPLIYPYFNVQFFGYLTYYYISSPASRAKIIRDSEATGVPKTNLAYLRTFPILLPPLSEQHSIAHILGTLDDKIDLNQHINDTLEGIAQALFKSWFVDFDPVIAKAEGQKPEGMDDATIDLFPSAFTESILGPIPEGWEISSLGDFIELAYGRALKADGRNEGFVPVYGSNGQIGWHDAALAKGPGIVVGRKGNPGTVIYVHEDFFPIDTTFFVIPSQRVPSIIFLYMLMERLSLPGLSADSAVPGLNRNAAYSAQCILPMPSRKLCKGKVAKELL
jgi:type I restriction enzyme, S subunit